MFRKIVICFFNLLMLITLFKSISIAQGCTTPADCDDGNVCTSDTCLTSLGICLYVNNSDFCDDGLFCNGPDSCANGNCIVHLGNPCPGTSVCDEQRDNCACSDAFECNDGNPCTADSCPGNLCRNFPLVYSSCDDGFFCNGPDRCDSFGECTVHPVGNPCSETACNHCQEDSDSCIDPAGTPCDDGLFCNGVDTCSNGTCLHSGNPCPSNLYCSETTDLCEQTPETTTTTMLGPECIVTIEPPTEKVFVKDELQFSAQTLCNQQSVAGDYIWSVETSVGSGIDEESGLYTAGNQPGVDLVKIIDIANGNITDTVAVVVSRIWPLAYTKMWGDEKEEKLLLLRAFRDEILMSSNVGKKYVNLVYDNSIEIALLLLKDESLAANAGEVTEEFTMSVESLLRSDELQLNLSTIEKFKSLINRIEMNASLKLKTAIKKLKKDFEGDDIFKQLGIKIID